MEETTTTTTPDSGTTRRVRHSESKSVRCGVCGHVNLLNGRFYFWALEREAEVRCRNCGRLLSLG